MSIKILIVDDHSVVREGLRMFLAMDPELEVVGEAVNGKDALEKVAELHPDVVLMDLLMPEMDGIQATEILRKKFPDTEVIALTSVLEDAAVVNAIRAGAIGYLLKNTEAQELREAIKNAAQGKVQLSPQAAERLMREIRAPESPEKLTDREKEVLILVAKGKSNKEIAQELTVSITTVKSHVTNILRKLDLPSRTQAAIYAVREGLVSSHGMEDHL